jgi:hypothetical protein
MNQFDLLSSWLPTSGRLVLQPGKQTRSPDVNGLGPPAQGGRFTPIDEVEHGLLDRLLISSDTYRPPFHPAAAPGVLIGFHSESPREAFRSRRTRE